MKLSPAMVFNLFVIIFSSNLSAFVINAKAQETLKKQFCARLNKHIGLSLQRSGYSAFNINTISSNATSTIMAEYYNGNMSDIIRSKSLATSVNLPVKGILNSGTLMLNGYLSAALRLTKNANLALSAAELRFINKAAKKKDIILLANSASSLNSTRVKYIIKKARKAGIKIHLVWFASTKSVYKNNKSLNVLLRIVKQTGGKFIDFSGSNLPCSMLSA